MSVVGWVTLGVWLASLWCVIRAVRRPGLSGKLRALVAAALTGLLATVLTAFLAVLHLFYAFAGETLVAIVTTTPIGPEERFELVYEPAPGVAAAPLRAELRGDQWAISGGIVKWHPWLTGLGLKSYHRPTRISGQFASLQRQQTEPPTVHALEPADQVWEALYRAAPYLPIIDAAYGSSAFAYVEPGVQFEVSVSPTGYLIRRLAVDVVGRFQ